MAGLIIPSERSIELAADFEVEELRPTLRKIGKVAGFSAVKLGFRVSLGEGMRMANETVKLENPDLVTIYDHQKAGNDVDKIGKDFAKTVVRGGVDAAILFPMTSPLVEEAWIKELQDAGVGVIVGGEMTQQQFRRSEGGRIADEKIDEIYIQAAELGVRDFVVPGSKVLRVAHYRMLLDEYIGIGAYSFHSPGFVDQGGVIGEAGKQAGDSFHAIIGTGIYAAEDPRAAMQLYTSQIQ